jgi:uncharacterized protein
MTRPGKSPRKGMVRSALVRFLPTTDEVRNSRVVRWMGPAVQHPRLWHLSRRGVALGIGIGIFFGLLLPVAQIPFAAVLAVAFRANITVAVASTLVTNPFTFAPLYYLAYRIGAALIGNGAPELLEAELESAPEVISNWFIYALERMAALGKPLIVGVVLLASVAGVAAYMAVMIAWRWRVLAKLRQRRRERAAGLRA